jgi:predicted RNA-binding protein with PIN domain
MRPVEPPSSRLAIARTHTPPATPPAIRLRAIAANVKLGASLDLALALARVAAVVVVAVGVVMTRARVRPAPDVRALARATATPTRRRATREMSLDVFAPSSASRASRAGVARAMTTSGTSTSRSTRRRRGDVAARASKGKRREGDDRGARDASSTPPPRITKRTNGMSVATQIKLVERFKSLSGGDGSNANARANAGRGTSGTSAKPIEGGRRKGADGTRDRTYEAELARRRAEKKREARLRSELERFSGGGEPPLLLVDGYNVCGLEGADGVEEANAAFRRGDMDAARVALTKEVMDFKSFSGYAVALVWDADRNRDKDEDEIEGDLDVDGFMTVYSVKNDADSWIEARVAQEIGADKKSNRVVYVATSDNALSSIARGTGAYVVTAKAFVEELRKASQGEKEILQEMAIAARWNSSKKMSNVGVRDDDVKRKLLEMYKTAPNMEAPANAPKGDFKRHSETTKMKQAPKAPKWAEMRTAQRRQNKP